MRRLFGFGFVLVALGALLSTPAVASAALIPSFEAASGGTTGVTPNWIRLADVDTNGVLDYVVTNLGDPGEPGSVTVRLGDGSGGFTGGSTVIVGGGPNDLALDDFDGDGHVDLATSDIDSDTVSVRLGAGDGSFSAGTDVVLAAASSPSQLASGDFDGDGTVDLALASSGTSSLSILRGDGAGAFLAPVDFGTSVVPTLLEAADVDGDGDLDLLCGDLAGGFGDVSSLRVYLNNGSGTFAAGPTIVEDSLPRAVAVGDLDGNGTADLAVANFTGADPLRAALALGDISVYSGTGTGIFNQVGPVLPIDHPTAVGLGDMTRDGVYDLAALSGDSDTVFALVGDGAGHFGNATSAATGSSPVALQVGRINGDTAADLAIACQGPSTVSALLNTTTAPPTTALVTSPASPNGNAGWFVSTPAVSLQRGTPGVTYFARDATATLASTSSSADPVALSVAEGTHAYSWFSVSSIEATEVLRAGTVKVDTQAPTTTTNLTSAWTSGTVVATFTASDPASGSGVDRIEYAVGGAAAHIYVGAPVPIANEGTTTVEYAAIDVAGTREDSKSVDVRIDNGKPTVDIAGVPEGWALESVPLTLSGSDALSGVAGLRYRLNEGAVRVPSGSLFTVSTPGTNTVEFWSIDNAGNESDHKTATVKVDTSPPNTTLQGWFAGNWVRETTVTLSATDSGAGVDHISYVLDVAAGGQETTYTGPIPITKEGLTTIDYWATDLAGRMETPRQRTIRVDRTEPSLDATVSSSYDYQAKILLRGTDALSGIAYYQWSIDGGLVANNASVIVQKPGRHTLVAKVYDYAGNVSATRTWTFVVRTNASLTAPSAGRSTLARNKTYTFSGILKPKHAAAPGLVRMYVDERVNGRWRRLRTTGTSITQGSSYTKYAGKVKFTKKGRYRVMVGHSDAYHVPSFSKWTYLTVN